MAIQTNLLDLPPGSTFKVKDDEDVWTVVPRDEFDRECSWANHAPEKAVTATYPSLLGGVTYDYVEPNEIEKVLSVAHPQAEAKPQTEQGSLGQFIFNYDLVELAINHERTVVFTYQKKKNGETRNRVVQPKDFSYDRFGGYDATRDGKYRQFKFERVEGEIELT